jgi:hypothetical protein
MTAPKRIWLDVSLVDSPRKTLACNLATAKQQCALATDEQYIRADLVAELVQAARDYLPQVGEPARDQKDMRLDAALRAIKETDA